MAERSSARALFCCVIALTAHAQDWRQWGQNSRHTGAAPTANGSPAAAVNLRAGRSAGGRWNGVSLSCVPGEESSKSSGRRYRLGSLLQTMVWGGSPYFIQPCLAATSTHLPIREW